MILYALMTSCLLNLIFLILTVVLYLQKMTSPAAIKKNPPKSRSSRNLSFLTRKRKSLKSKWKKFWGWLRNQIFYPLFCQMSVKNNLAVFESYRGENFSGNPKYIMKEVAARAPHFKCVFSVMKPVSAHYGRNCIQVRRMGLKYYYYLARAKFTVNNVNFPDFLVKRPGTVHIQTMHGTPLKLMGSDIIRIEEKAHTIDLLGLFTRSKRWDVLVCPNAYTADIFSRVFRYRGKILDSGYPRNDIFVQRRDDLEFQNQLKESFGLPIDRKILLYAPTWKDYRLSKKISNPSSLGINLDFLRELIGDEYIILFKLHHLVANNLNFERYKGFAWSMSHHADIQELCLISDCLITDYSSIMFDYTTLGRPMIFFISDFERYSGSRGMYFDMREQVPGPLVYDTEELATAILQLDKNSERYTSKYRAFQNKFSAWEKGTAAERVVEEYILTNGRSSK